MHRYGVGRAALVVLALVAPSCAAQQTTRSDEVEVVVAPAEAAPPKESSGEAVIITVEPASVGDRFEHMSRSHVGGEITVRGEVVPIKSTKMSRYTVEILAVEGGRTVKQRVRYQAFEEHEDPPPRDKPNAPVLEKAYVLERRGDGLVITDDAGAPITGSELEYMDASWKHFGQPKRVKEALAKTRLRVGEEAPDLAAAYAADQREGGDTITKMTVRLKETRGDVAVFEYTMEGTTEDLSGAVMRVEGTREVSLSTGEELRDAGTVTIDGGALGSGVVFELRGNGEDTATKL